MANLTVRNLDDEIARELKKRARTHNRSLEAELRQILTEAVRAPSRDAELRALAKRIKATTRGVPQTDSTSLVREDRDR